MSWQMEWESSNVANFPDPLLASKKINTQFHGMIVSLLTIEPNGVLSNYKRNGNA